MSKPIYKYIYLTDKNDKYSVIVWDWELEEGYFSQHHKEKLKKGWKLFEKRKYLGEIKGVLIFEGDLVLVHYFCDCGNITSFIRMNQKRFMTRNWGGKGGNAFCDVKDIFPFRKNMEEEEHILRSLKFEIENWDKHIIEIEREKKAKEVRG